MGHLAANTPPATSDALTGVLRSKGFEVRDFDVREDDETTLSDLFGVMGGLLRVRCFSTGEERMYPTGAGSAWLGAFLMDLARGHFASAARELQQPAAA
ncbi:MAG TPA: hypothetical protein VHM00_18750 [Caldimonas sp.]|jgi:hypothetical protein|nr:hypothetical protein [Caldimonas sp.]HEX2543108.1 hypothetical protein [Caldimonas sp.]